MCMNDMAEIFAICDWNGVTVTGKCPIVDIIVHIIYCVSSRRLQLLMLFMHAASVGTRFFEADEYCKDIGVVLGCYSSNMYPLVLYSIQI